MPAPAVSVVMPVRDGTPRLDDSVRSIVTQSFTDFELVIVDDASTDSATLCTEIARRLSALSTTTGHRVVERVVHVARESGGAPPPALPDLVVHWSNAAVAPGAWLASPDLAIPVIVRRITGEHTSNGWYAAQGDDIGWPEAIDAASLLLAALTQLATAMCIAVPGVWELGRRWAHGRKRGVRLCDAPAARRYGRRRRWFAGLRGFG